jgi:hypothetical protein
VLGLSRARPRVRPWMAVIAAYAVGLQLLLTGVVASHMAVGAPMAADAFVTCLGSDEGDGHERSDQPLQLASCVLCVATIASPAILSAGAIEIPRPDGDISRRWPVRPAAIANKHRTPRLSQAPPQYA